MVLGRAAELKYLNSYYDREDSQILVVYGAEGVGKTALLNRFTEDKSSYCYKARSCSYREQLYQWGKELSGKRTRLPQYPALEDIFRVIAEPQRTKKVLILDDFHHLLKGNPDFISDLAALLNTKQPGSRLMVILCSSAAAWVESRLDADGTAGLLKVNQLGFQELCEYFRGFLPEQCVEAYAVLGGLPGMWQYFDDKLDIRENICRNILIPQAYLHRLGERLILEELREAAVYNTILAAIAEGNRKLNDLYLHTGFSRAKISVYLKNLIELELVEKVFSYEADGKENALKGVYRISNHFVHFYFTCLYPYLSVLEGQKPGDFYNEYIAPVFKNYVADYFRLVCAQKLKQWNQYRLLPFEYNQSGEWVGKSGTIDLVAQDEQAHTLIGQCNWEKPMMTYDDYEWLLYSTKQAKLKPDYIYLFSVGWFDERLSLEAKVKPNIRLVGMEEF